MKKLIISLTLLLSSCCWLKAQNNDIKYLGGHGSAQAPHNSELSIGIDVFTPFLTHGETFINFTYSTTILPNFYLGGSLGYSDNTFVRTSEKYTTSDKKKTIRYNEILPMVYAKYNWLDRPCFSLYSRVGVGALITVVSPKSPSNIDSNNVKFALQVTPIGIEAGKGIMRFYTEVGIGYTYIMEAGLRFRF